MQHITDARIGSIEHSMGSTPIDTAVARVACNRAIKDQGAQAPPAGPFYGFATTIGVRSTVFADGKSPTDDGEVVGVAGASGGFAEQGQSVVEAAVAAL